MLKGVGAIILLYCFKITKVNRFRKSLMVFFVCATLISVKSKYGSCSGSCTGLIKFNILKYILDFVVYIRKVPFVGMTG